MTDIVPSMNLNPAAEELTEIVKSLQDFINDSFEVLKDQRPSVTPEEFTVSMQNLFCDFLDTTHSVEKVLEKTIEKVSNKYEVSYSKEFGLATVYNIYDYQKAKIDSMSKEEVTDFLNHPAGKGSRK